ncbi:MAG: hypothetical protein A2464_13050 [Deltaproteobacteria bacterium RIFOXYC2_FULL_48_10]|nr:MAG: hypothetical protein A2464_13050 [Deltaproteobacteria bacterium RIFOXYC2_FULL_48_10]
MIKENFKPFFVKEKKMKKLIALMFAVLFLGAGIAGASDLTMTGSYFVRGTYEDNLTYDATAPQNDRHYGYYDHELSLDTKWKMDDTTFVFARFEIRDQSWGRGGDTVTEAVHNGDTDNNIVAQEVWGQTTFTNGISLRTGLMGAGAWGTSFANTYTEAFRVFGTFPTQIGAVIAILEKPNNGISEQGSSVIGENNDLDVYHLALVTKVGDLNIKPIVSFIDANNNNWGADSQTILAQLSLDGKAGMIGYEADFIYRDVDRTVPEVAGVPGTQDYSLFGAYGNIWYQMQALKLGAFAAYGSWDDDAQQGFDFGDDFAPGNLLIMGDDLLGEGAGNVGNQAGADGGMVGVTLFGIYGSYAVTDKLSLSAVAAYATPDRDAATAAAIQKWDDADIFELSAGFAYKITPSLTYDGGIGMAEVDFGATNLPDPDTIVEAFHRLSYNF